MIRNFLIVTFALIVFNGCAGIQPIQRNMGNKVVCVLFKDTRFKIEVVGNLTKQLSKKGYTVVTGSVKQAKYFNAADYAAVVYMAELWAWHTPWHAKKYFRKHNEVNTIVFVITSGDPDITITKPFDAVTSASAPDKVEPVAQEILNKLSNILR